MKGRYVYEDGGVVTHVFFKGSSKPKMIEVPVKRAIWIDPSAGRYVIVNGKMRRVNRPLAPLPQITVRRKAA
jgi:hypothetical protein